MEMKIAQRRARGIQAMHSGAEGGRAPARQDPVTLDNPGDVYDELEQLRTQTDCQFCHGVIDSLMDAPPGEAKEGYEELRSYVREVDRIRERDVTEEEAEQIVGELVDRWEVVPKYAAGLA